MAELDYALVAEYAKVDAGKLNIIGGGYTELTLDGLPHSGVVAVAGRIRAPSDTETITLEVTFEPPGGGANIRVSGIVEANEATHRYKDRIGILFALNQVLTFLEPGLCRIEIVLDGKSVKSLYFDVGTGA